MAYIRPTTEVFSRTGSAKNKVKGWASVIKMSVLPELTAFDRNNEMSKRLTCKIRCQSSMTLWHPVERKQILNLEIIVSSNTSQDCRSLEVFISLPCLSINTYRAHSENEKIKDIGFGERR